MVKLNFPDYTFRIKSRENKLFIFDPVRKKELVLTPEEWVRQHTLEYLFENEYPKGLTSVESVVKINGMSKRTDILVFDRDKKPFLVVECKAPNINITQKTFDQIARYNMELESEYLMLTNGLNHYFCKMNHNQGSYSFLPNLPQFPISK